MTDESKSGRRRQAMSQRLRQLDDTFESERDIHYNEMLHSLQSSLYALHQGTNSEFLEELADLEEERDNQLVELYLWERYQTEQVQKQFEEEQRAASTEYEQMLQLVKDKLRARLEGNRKRLSEDRALLDVANDHAFFLTAANAAVRADRSLLSGSDRRALRRRELEEASGLSGNEGRSRRARGTTTAASDAETGTDRDLDAVLKEFDHPTTRHITKSYQGVKTLRPDEALQDLALIREQSRR